MTTELARPAAIALTCLAACTKPVPPPASTPPPPTDPVIEQRMQAHFFEVSAVKDALIDGDLETLIERARALAEQENPADYPMVWRPHIVRLIEAAEGTASSPELDTAAGRTADLAANCGRCHQSVEAKPDFQAVPEPRDDESVEATMERHQWAADRMWEGIVGPSDDAWLRGTTLFVASPGCAVDPDADLSVVMQELCTLLGSYGGKAKAATSVEDRARVYGDFLRTCAACHNAGA